MIQNYIPFLALIGLVSLTVCMSFNVSSIVVPGWHTTILPPYVAVACILLIVLFLVIIGYCSLSKNGNRSNWTLFTIYFILTLISAIYLIVPSLFLDIQQENIMGLMPRLSFRLKLRPVSWSLFIIAQISFLIYYIKLILAFRADPEHDILRKLDKSRAHTNLKS